MRQAAEIKAKKEETAMRQCYSCREFNLAPEEFGSLCGNCEVKHGRIYGKKGMLAYEESMTDGDKLVAVVNEVLNSPHISIRDPIYLTLMVNWLKMMKSQDEVSADA